jgi:glutamate-ammonia-ligase adenylyltransferase
VKNLSITAKVTSGVLFETCVSEIEIKYEVSLNTDYTLCSLGKLGGNELNYSSDIDLILFYKENYEIKEIKKDYHELITEALHLFIQEATAVTSESYLYRVDFRLRPDGRNSLLCRSMENYLKYYETRGEDWERQMLIKLGFVCGNTELFNEFKKLVEPFIYPKSLRSSVIETIQRMKRSIESRLIDERNIKLITGGIRDIEFSVQALQLMNGGNKPSLKNGNTLEALERLFNEGLITRTEFVLLNDAYIIYRKIEHFVQLMNDKQTHSLPQSKEHLNKLSKFLGFNSDEDLVNAIDKYRTSVRVIYESIIGKDNEGGETDIFSSIKFDDPKQANSNQKFLSLGLSLLGEKQFDKSTIKLFQKIEPVLMTYLSGSIAPDIVLTNFVKVIRNSKFPSVWYKAFEDEQFFNSFLRTCELSQRSIDYISTSKKLADLFLSKKVYHELQESNNYSLRDLLLILSVQHSAWITLFPKFSKLLSAKISEKINEAAYQLNMECDYFIGGLGSFANEEMSFGSDLDLIVVVDDLKQATNAEKMFQSFLSLIREELSPFDVDFRLRPEGANSPIVWDLEGYKRYINERMRIWEFQALSKLKLVSGSQELFDQFTTSLAEKIESFPKTQIIDEVFKMYRTKLNLSNSNQQKIDFKNSPGALLTIDTILSLYLLSNTDSYKAHINTSAVEKFAILEEQLPADKLTEIKKDFFTLKNMQIASQNLLNQNKSTLPSDKKKRLLLGKYLGYSELELKDKIDTIFKSNTSLLNKIKG